jgi:molybdate transport system substrate-binding protein
MHILNIHTLFRLSLVAALFTQIACKPSSSSQVDHTESEQLTIFCAASTTNAMQDLAKEFKEQTGVSLITSFASSSTLAKQIEQGAPADLYLSANPKWMNYLEQAGKLVEDSREDLLGNRIVLIAPSSSPLNSVEINAQLDLSALLGEDGRIAMGDPQHVPAGIYGKDALETLGLWSSVHTRVAPMSDVRAALTIVERGETPLGIVYATDAAMSDQVKVVGVFPADSHPAIVYPVAIVSNKQVALARSFLVFLNSPEASEIFEQYGFALAQ